MNSSHLERSVDRIGYVSRLIGKEHPWDHHNSIKHLSKEDEVAEMMLRVWSDFYLNFFSHRQASQIELDSFTRTTPT